MKRAQLVREIFKKKTYLCVGLDTDPEKVPAHLRDAEDPLFEFNKQIIDATRDLCVAYKPNTAFYEACGSTGWETLKKTAAYIGDSHLKIADAKRGDIGNTSERYAHAFFRAMDYDAITVAPYMGEDSVRPFVTSPEKWIILLAHTSNPGSADFQLFGDHLKLFEEVIIKSQQWVHSDQLMFVVGATRADRIGHIRKLAPENFFLVPGIGAQGGSLEDVSLNGMNRDCGLLVNASRSIIYASSGTDFAEAARREAQNLQSDMSVFLDRLS
ncbi:MAG: orotidine-5'-phosphate decarboxylase [Cyclobacteriaceae bacterium]